MRVFLISSPLMALFALLLREGGDVYVIATPEDRQAHDILVLLLGNGVEEDAIFAIWTDLSAGTHWPGVRAAYFSHDRGSFTVRMPFASLKAMRDTRTVITLLRTLREWIAERRQGKRVAIVIGSPTWWLDSAVRRHFSPTTVDFHLSEDGMLSYVSLQGFWRHPPLAKVRRGYERFWYLLALRPAGPTAYQVAYRSFPEHSPSVAAGAQLVRIPWERLPELRATESNLEYPANAVVFLSQSLSEDGILSRGDEIAVIVDTLAKIHSRRRQAGPILLKPHPRDEIAKTKETLEALTSQGIHCEMHPLTSRPIEGDFCQLAQTGACLVGFWSAPLFYFSALVGRGRTFSLLPDVAAMSPYLEHVHQQLLYHGLMDFAEPVKG